METYLEALERLGRLLDAGVLTREEFEAEKAQLLETRALAKAPKEQTPQRRLVNYVLLSSVAVVLIGAGISYAVFNSMARSGQEREAQDSLGDTPQNTVTSDGQILVITFANASKCEPGESLSDLLSRLREAGAADEGSDLRMINLAGVPNPVEAQSNLRAFGQQQVRLTRLPVSATWRGLRVTEIRTAEWEQGHGFQVRFESSPENLLRTLRDAGFTIKSLEKPTTHEGVFAAIEKSPGGALLTCMMSNKAGHTVAGDVEEKGE